MPIGGGQLSRDPNLCASCSSIADGMDEEACEVVSSGAAPTQEVTSSGMLTVIEAEAEKILTSERAHEDSRVVSRLR
jgi:hypothetical protein